MKFTETPLAGLYVVDVEPIEDARGSFARTWCAREFASLAGGTGIVQSNMSFNRRRGTVRGMHWQCAPHAESKLVRCTRGALFDVAVDLRPESKTYLQWFGAELDQDNRRMLFIPERFAHGLQTLADDTEVLYLMSEFYAPECQRGARYNDPKFGIDWPLEVAVVSDKDAGWPDFAGEPG